MTTLVKPKLEPFVERLAADELLFELRRGDWRPLPPTLLDWNPFFRDPDPEIKSHPSPAFVKPRYLTAILPSNPFVGNEALELSIMFSDYGDALMEIEGLGYGDVWLEFFATQQRLYRIERRSSNLKLGETVVVTQNRLTGPAHRRAMSCIWQKAVVRPHKEKL